jgi:hypothetical protein
MNDPSLALDAFDRALEHPETLMNAYALLNRIRLTSSDSVVDAADQDRPRTKASNASAIRRSRSSGNRQQDAQTDPFNFHGSCHPGMAGVRTGRTAAMAEEVPDEQGQ